MGGIPADGGGGPPPVPLHIDKVVSRDRVVRMQSCRFRYKKYKKGCIKSPPLGKGKWADKSTTSYNMLDFKSFMKKGNGQDSHLVGGGGGSGALF